MDSHHFLFITATFLQCAVCLPSCVCMYVCCFGNSKYLFSSSLLLAPAWVSCGHLACRLLFSGCAPKAPCPLNSMKLAEIFCLYTSKYTFHMCTNTRSYTRIHAHSVYLCRKSPIQWRARHMWPHCAAHTARTPVRRAAPLMSVLFVDALTHRSPSMEFSWIFSLVQLTRRSNRKKVKTTLFVLQFTLWCLCSCASVRVSVSVALTFAYIQTSFHFIALVFANIECSA